MIVNIHDPSAISRLVGRLRRGEIGLEHNPPAIADVLEAVQHERKVLEIRVADLEMQTESFREREGYARGFQDAIREVVALLGEHGAAAVARIRPSFERANTERVGR